ncbi:MAG: hypothetical protein ACFFDY_15025 [Candidatus Thorarchaeota archaeon]
MPEEPLIIQIKELKSEILLKNKEISEYLDKIDYLENIIMEIEASSFEKSDNGSSLLNIQSKFMERENQELKKKLSFLRLENVKLKQELEKVRKEQLIDSSLIQIVDAKSYSPSKSSATEEFKIEEDEITQKEQFKDIQLKCPECETSKKMKIPAKIINQGNLITTINIPKGMICEHSFQVFLDKYLNVKRYQVVDFDFPQLEYYESQIVQDTENLTNFVPLNFSQGLINLLRNSINNIEILGAVIFTREGKVKYASIPSDILFNIIKEFEVRKEKQLQDIAKMFLELNDHKKICSEYIEVQNTEFILVLILSKKVNFGMANMIFRDIKKKIKSISSKSK